MEPYIIGNNSQEGATKLISRGPKLDHKVLNDMEVKNYTKISSFHINRTTFESFVNSNSFKT